MHELKITNDIKNLNTKKIKNNLFFYKYDTRKLKSLIRQNTDKESLSYLSTYSSFKGEVFENIIYEHLLIYAKHNKNIKSFMLKGPHETTSSLHYKSGFMIDKSSQIVYKSAYKDISEFDALFFTETEVYFVEMSTSKKTASLNKRLNKKSSLLKVLFPNLEIKALIVLTKGSVGLTRFPNYCTIWITDDEINHTLLNEIIFNKKHKDAVFNTFTDRKFKHTSSIKYSKFQYFQTLEWILRKSRAHEKFVVDLSFFTSESLGLYFDIFTKLYIGYMNTDTFVKMSSYEHNEIKKVLVSIEKINSKTYDIVYYIKHENGKLYRVFIDENNELNVKEKEKEGFTNAEVRFLLHILKDDEILNEKNINFLRKNIPKFIH